MKFPIFSKNYLSRILPFAAFSILSQSLTAEIHTYSFSGVFSESFRGIVSDFRTPFTGFVEVDTEAVHNQSANLSDGESKSWVNLPGFRLYIKTEVGLEHDSAAKYFEEQTTNFTSIDRSHTRIDRLRDVQRTNTPGGFMYGNSRASIIFSESPPLGGDLISKIPSPWNIEDYTGVRVVLHRVIRNRQTHSIVERFHLVCDSLDSWERVYSTPLELIGETLKVMEELVLEDDKEAKKLEKVKKYFGSALNEEYWVDDSTLGEDGKKVFHEISKGVYELEKLAEKVPDQSEYFDEVITLFIQISEDLAQITIDLAIEEGGDEKKIKHAHKEMAKAQKELSKGHFKHAIERFEHAWKDANKAIKK